jgi:hypothetical protein
MNLSQASGAYDKPNDYRDPMSKTILFFFKNLLKQLKLWLKKII